jgi:hypothetical protein
MSGTTREQYNEYSQTKRQRRVPLSLVRSLLEFSKDVGYMFDPTIIWTFAAQWHFEIWHVLLIIQVVLIPTLLNHLAIFDNFTQVNLLSLH